MLVENSLMLLLRGELNNTNIEAIRSDSYFCLFCRGHLAYCLKRTQASQSLEEPEWAVEVVTLQPWTGCQLASPVSDAEILKIKQYFFCGIFFTEIAYIGIIHHPIQLGSAIEGQNPPLYISMDKPARFRNFWDMYYTYNNYVSKTFFLIRN